MKEEIYQIETKESNKKIKRYIVLLYIVFGFNAYIFYFNFFSFRDSFQRGWIITDNITNVGFIDSIETQLKNEYNINPDTLLTSEFKLKLETYSKSKISKIKRDNLIKKNTYDDFSIPGINLSFSAGDFLPFSIIAILMLYLFILLEYNKLEKIVHHSFSTKNKLIEEISFYISLRFLNRKTVIKLAILAFPLIIYAFNAIDLSIFAIKNHHFIYSFERKVYNIQILVLILVLVICGILISKIMKKDKSIMNSLDV